MVDYLSSEMKIVYHPDFHDDVRLFERTKTLVERALRGEILLGVEGFAFSESSFRMFFNGYERDIKSPFVFGIEDNYSAARWAANVIFLTPKCDGKAGPITAHTTLRDLGDYVRTKRIVYLYVGMAAAVMGTNFEFEIIPELKNVALEIHEQNAGSSIYSASIVASRIFEKEGGLPGSVNVFQILDAAERTLSNFQMTVNEVIYTKREAAWTRNVRNAHERNPSLELHVIVGVGHLWPVLKPSTYASFQGIDDTQANLIAQMYSEIDGPRLLELLPGSISPDYTWHAPPCV